jgi:hypothetical protein
MTYHEVVQKFEDEYGIKIRTSFKVHHCYKYFKIRSTPSDSLQRYQDGNFRVYLYPSNSSLDNREGTRFYTGPLSECIKKCKTELLGLEDV